MFQPLPKTDNHNRSAHTPTQCFILPKLLSLLHRAVPHSTSVLFSSVGLACHTTLHKNLIPNCVFSPPFYPPSLASQAVYKRWTRSAYPPHKTGVPIKKEGVYRNKEKKTQAQGNLTFQAQVRTTSDSRTISSKWRNQILTHSLSFSRQHCDQKNKNKDKKQKDWT
jgi:hypothetical protein